MKQRNIWLLSFLTPFIMGFLSIIIYINTHDNQNLSDLTVQDWLSYLGTCATVGAFLVVILDKVLSEKAENHKKWLAEIPVVVLASPCNHVILI